MGQSNIISTIIFCLLYAIINVSGSAIIKYSLKGQQLTYFTDWVRFIFSFAVIFAFILIFISALIMFKALSSGTFTFVVPVATGLNFMLTICLGYFVFKDKISIQSFIGFAMIICGILFLSIQKQGISHE